MAYQSHVGDAILHPANLVWDQQWEAAYKRLEALWAAVDCPGDSP